MEAKLTIVDVDWNASKDDVYRMLAHVHEFFGQFSAKDYGLASVSRPGIVTRSDGKVHDILITAQGLGWGQYILEYGHEFCHVYTNVWKLNDGVSHWINEVICELASLCCLQDVLERTGPIIEPKLNIDVISAYLETQKANRVDLLGNEEVDAFIKVPHSLDDLPYEYDPSRQVQQALSMQLYPFVSKNAAFWTAVQYLNDYESIPHNSLAYMQKWHDRAQGGKEEIAEFSRLLGIPLQ